MFGSVVTVGQDESVLVRQFINEEVYPVPGELIPYKDFYQRFLGWNGCHCSRHTVSKAIPPEHQTGFWNGNVTYLTNCAWQPCIPSEPWIVTRNRRIWRPNHKANQ